MVTHINHVGKIYVERDDEMVVDQAAKNMPDKKTGSMPLEFSFNGKSVSYYPQPYGYALAGQWSSFTPLCPVCQYNGSGTSCFCRAIISGF
jgi:hypothetical protein